MYTQTPIFFVINQAFPWPVFHFWIISPFTVDTLRKTPFAPLDRTFAPKKSDICAINVCPFAPLNLNLNLNDPIGHLRHFLIEKNTSSILTHSFIFVFLPYLPTWMLLCKSKLLIISRSGISLKLRCNREPKGKKLHISPQTYGQSFKVETYMWISTSKVLAISTKQKLIFEQDCWLLVDVSNCDMYIVLLIYF